MHDIEHSACSRFEGDALDGLDPLLIMPQLLATEHDAR
jgi:hypothetical protein